MTDPELVEFLKWCLPKMQLRWVGFRKVRGTIRKRLNRRIRDLGLEDLAAYRRRLENDPSEWPVLDTICRIPVSRFYRDTGVYEMLASRILPERAETACKEKAGRLWVLSAGCASGEEPYTISLIWHLRVAHSYPGCAIDILAVDIDEHMLSRAMAACYPAGTLKELPNDLLERGLEPSGNDYCVRERFRQSVRFQKADLRRCVPAGPFDVIFCRNTAFTYFNRMTQVSVLSKFETALRPGGYLVIGSHETLVGDTQAFQHVVAGAPVYRKINASAAA